MAKYNINPNDFSKLLSRFFEKDFHISQDLLQCSINFVFGGMKHPGLKQVPALLETLEYLMDVRDRNHLETLEDLELYYEKKLRSLDDMFDKFEHAKEEERFAVSFEGACRTYLKMDHASHISKEYIYYPINTNGNVTVCFDNISYKNTVEQETQHLSQIRENKLADQQNICFVSLEKVNQLISN